MILEVGTDVIEQRVRELTRRCLDELAGMGWASVTPAQDERRGPMVCIPAREPARLCQTLMEQDIVASFRDNNLRATLHFYNSAEDVLHLVTALQQCRARHHPHAK